MAGRYPIVLWTDTPVAAAVVVVVVVGFPSPCDNRL